MLQILNLAEAKAWSEKNLYEADSFLYPLKVAVNRGLLMKIDEEHFVRLKKEIDNLVNKISQKVRKENSYLKVRISFLEAENARLNNILYGNSGVKVVEYFNPPQAQTPFIN